MTTTTYDLTTEQWLQAAVESIPAHPISSFIILVSTTVLLYLVLGLGWNYLWNKKDSPSILFVGIVSFIAAISLTMKDSLNGGNFNLFNETAINAFLNNREGAAEFAKKNNLERYGKKNMNAGSSLDNLTKDDVKDILKNPSDAVVDTLVDKGADLLSGGLDEPADSTDHGTYIDQSDVSNNRSAVTKGAREECHHAQFLLSILFGVCFLLLVVFVPLMAYKRIARITPVPASDK